MKSCHLRLNGILAGPGRLRAVVAVRIAMIAFLAVCGTAPALAQDWPKGLIRLVVPFAAGGNTDIMARLLAASLGKELGQSVIVDNRGGAGGAIAAEFVARAAANGYTLFFGTTGQLSVVPLVQRVRYDPGSAFAPVSIYGSNPDILAVNAQLPVDSVSDLISYAKSHPNEINYGSGGVGTISHLATALFAKRAGIELQHVPFRGGAQTITELMAGHIQMYLGNTSEILPMASSKDLKLLGVTSEQRLRDLPNLPTVRETLSGYVIDAWNGLLAPAATPRPVLDRLEAASIQAAKEPEVVARLEKLGIQARGSTAAEFRRVIESEGPVYRNAVAAAGIAAP